MKDGPQQYWRKGMIPSLIDSKSEPKKINPTLCYTSNPGFRLNSASFPLEAFHLARGLLPVKGTSSRNTQEPNFESIVADACNQFSEWCNAARWALHSTQASNPSTRIRFFSGDALSLCFALQSYSLGCQTSGHLVKPWSNTPLVLDGDDYSPSALRPAPHSFNTIETSNLVDHVGTISLLAAIIPIFNHSPSSVIHTECLTRGMTSDMYQGLRNSLYADIPIFQVLFGISPSSASSYLQSDCEIHEILIGKICHRDAFGNQGCNERVSWKDAITSAFSLDGKNGHSPPTLVLEPSDLAELLFDIYHRMFDEEDWAPKLLTASLKTSSWLDYYHNIRSSFAALLLIARKRLPLVDWKVVMKMFLNLVNTDKVLTTSKIHFQDLCCQFHLHGLINLDSPTCRWVNKIDGTHQGRFSEWTKLPAIIRVVLVVPRTHTASIEDILTSLPVNPTIQCDTKGAGGLRYIFSSLRACFGRVISSPDSDGEGPIVIEEDASGFRGHSSLIVSFWIPMHLLLGSCPSVSEIGLSLRSSPCINVASFPQFGPDLRLYLASVNNKDHVHFSRELPSWINTPWLSHSPIGSADERSCVKIALDTKTFKIDDFTIRMNLTRSDQKQSLLAGAAVTTEAVSLCKVVVRFSGHSLDYLFPYPINQKTIRLRVARKSSYIEVVAQVWTPSSYTWKADVNRTPVVRVRSNIFTSWNLHHVVLDSLPLLDLSIPTVEHCDWMEHHLTLAFSDEETKIRENSAYDADPNSFDTLVSIKHGFMSFLMILAGIHRDQKDIFAVYHSKGKELHTLLFVNGLRFDLAGNTIVADVFVFPITKSTMESPAAVDALRVQQANPSPGLWPQSLNECVAWRQFLPAFVERCRQWSHKDTCEYLSAKCIPPSPMMEDGSYCSCGQGQDTDLFMKKFSQWKVFAPYVTRAAISPVFAVPYLEDVGGFLYMRDRGRGPELVSSAAALAGKRCAKCLGMGKPSLLVCSRCKKTKYCSGTCQKADWKQHKPLCTA